MDKCKVDEKIDIKTREKILEELEDLLKYNLSDSFNAEWITKNLDKGLEITIEPIATDFENVFEIGIWFNECPITLEVINQESGDSFLKNYSDTEGLMDDIQEILENFQLSTTTTIHYNFSNDSKLFKSTIEKDDYPEEF